jgi:HK97 family phage major capsid protein
VIVSRNGGSHTAFFLLISTEVTMDDETKSGARNSAADKAKLNRIRECAKEVHDLTLDLDPEEQAPDPEKMLVIDGASVKALGDGRVAGYLVRFSTPSDPDLTGDFFSKSTEFGIIDGANVPIFYQHGYDGVIKARRIGRGIIKYDDVGLWLEAQLEMRDEYEKAIEQMANDGKLGWSSGAAGHLCEREQVGKAWHIKTWLIAEGSLTPTPAEPRNSAMPLKSLITADADEAGEDKSEGVIENPTIQKTNEVITMDESLKSEITGLVGEAVKAALEAAKPVNAGGIVSEIEAKKAPAHIKDRKSPSYGKALAAWFTGDTPAGFAKGMEMTLQPESVKGAWEGGTDNEGGYAVPDDFYNSIVEKRDLASWVRQAPVQRFTTNRDRILIPTEATASTKMVVTDEEAGYDENEPVFGQTALTIYKFTKMIKASEEVMEDAVDIERYLSSTIARAQALAENYYCTVGTGTGMPQGFVYASTSSSVMMASPDVIVSTDLTGAMGTLPAGYVEPGSMGLVMAPSVYWYIRGITGNPFQFADMPQGSGNIGSGPALFGVPVFLAPDCDALTVHSGKVVTYGNLGFYAFAERNGLTIARNPYLYQANGIIGVFAKARFGAAFTQTAAAVHMLGHND